MAGRVDRYAHCTGDLGAGIVREPRGWDSKPRQKGPQV